ncbi:hypothetical protein O3M35_000374 [Rhynocoris fuscipes]|uniref:SCP domain-containing protein n=1 Tax=Rhynocoris fuscipes TaxID=488301 RepID=A0AAW1DNG8_9HEMI
MMFILTIAFCLMLSSSVYSKNLACTNGNKLLGMKSLTESERQIILKAHNDYRNYVASGKQAGQPPAENMLEMTWDDHAATQAFNWASECKFEHNRPRTLTNRPMGQNLYIKLYSLGQDVNTTFYQWVDSMIKGWYDEVNYYKFGGPFSTQTGHYTQLIWAKSDKIGCGYSYYKESNNFWYAGYLVCNYAPAGNYIGQKPYRTGKTNCKKYNFQPSSRYSHLCTKN